MESQLDEQERRIAELEAALEAATSTTTTTTTSTTTTTTATTLPPTTTTTQATTTTIERRDVDGVFDLVDNTHWRYEGEGCVGQGGYDDLDENYQLVLKDDVGRVLAETNLGIGTPYQAGDLDTDYGATFCRWELTFRDVPMDREFYTVWTTRRGEITFSRADILTRGIGLVIGDD